MQPTLPHVTHCLTTVLWHHHTATCAWPAPCICAARYHIHMTQHVHLYAAHIASSGTLLLAHSSNCQLRTQPWLAMAAASGTTTHRMLAFPARRCTFYTDKMALEGVRRPAAGPLGLALGSRCQDLGHAVRSTPPANSVLGSPRASDAANSISACLKKATSLVASRLEVPASDTTCPLASMALHGATAYPTTPAGPPRQPRPVSNYTMVLPPPTTMAQTSSHFF